MIEFIAEELCVGCNKCVEVCPTDVLDAVPNGAPVIARQEDCHSCRQCSLRCPGSAIFVSLLSAPDPKLDQAKRQQLIAEGRLGAYAEWLGWKHGQHPSGESNPWREALRELRGERPPDPADRVRRQLYEARERNYI